MTTTHVNETRLASASTGTSLSTTAAFIQLPRKTAEISLTPYNFSSANVARYLGCPWLYVIKTTDDLKTAANATEYSEEAQDASTNTSVVLSSLASGGFLYVGSHEPFRGVYVDVDATNSTGSTALTVNYWNGHAWVDISATDGTSGTVSLDQDGSVTWTIPSAWKADTLKHIAGTALKFGNADFPQYWTRWQWDQDLDASVTLDAMTALNRSTAYDELVAGQALELPVNNGPGGISGLEALTDAGTAQLVVRATANGRFA